MVIKKEVCAVLRHLKHFVVLSGALPGKADIIKCMKAEPSFYRRSWLRINNFVSNRMQTRKKERITY